MLTVIFANVIGFAVIYGLWCFIEWKVVKIKPISDWNSDERSVLLVVLALFTLLGLMSC